jgi:hypothetical protein
MTKYDILVSGLCQAIGKLSGFSVPAGMFSQASRLLFQTTSGGPMMASFGCTEAPDKENKAIMQNIGKLNTAADRA